MPLEQNPPLPQAAGTPCRMEIRQDCPRVRKAMALLRQLAAGCSRTRGHRRLSQRRKVSRPQAPLPAEVQAWPARTDWQRIPHWMQAEPFPSLSSPALPEASFGKEILAVNSVSPPAGPVRRASLALTSGQGRTSGRCLPLPERSNLAVSMPAAPRAADPAVKSAPETGPDRPGRAQTPAAPPGRCAGRSPAGRGAGTAAAPQAARPCVRRRVAAGGSHPRRSEARSWEWLPRC